MGVDECTQRRRQQLLIDRAQAAVLLAVDFARLAGHATVTLDEHQTAASRAAATAAHARADSAVQGALDAVARIAEPGRNHEDVARGSPAAVFARGDGRQACAAGAEAAVIGSSSSR